MMAIREAERGDNGEIDAWAGDIARWKAGIRAEIEEQRRRMRVIREDRYIAGDADIRETHNVGRTGQADTDTGAGQGGQG